VVNEPTAPPAQSDAEARDAALRPGRLLQNFGFLSAGKLLGDLCTFALFVVLSRTFGEAGIGEYSFAIAFAGFFAVFADYGLYFLGLKIMSRPDTVSASDYGPVLALRLVLSTLAFFALVVVVFFLPFSYQTKSVLILIGIFQIAYTIVDGFATIFVARELMPWAAALELSLRAAIAAGGIAAVAAGANLVVTIATMPLFCGIQAGIACLLIRRRFGHLRPRTSWAQLLDTLREATPYAGTIILYQLSSRTDVAMLGILAGTVAAGVYSVAYRVIFLVQFVPYLASLAVLPSAARLHAKQQRGALATLYHETVSLGVVLGLPAAAGLWLIGPELIALLFGSDFELSGRVLRWLSVLLLFACLRHLLSLFLTACDRQGERTRREWHAALVNVVGNLVLIPIFGIPGAVAATLTSEAVLVVAFVVQLRSLFGWPRIGLRLAMSLAGTGAFCLGTALLPSPSLFLVLPFSIAVYLATLMLFRDFRQHELATVVALLRGRETGHG
jgi:O-antigen/teichoic acid export membrane protein